MSATDASGSPITAMNIEYTRIINPINAKSPKTIDLIPPLLSRSPIEKDFLIAFFPPFPASFSDCDIFPVIVLVIGLFSCLCGSLKPSFFF